MHAYAWTARITQVSNDAIISDVSGCTLNAKYEEKMPNFQKYRQKNV